MGGAEAMLRDTPKRHNWEQPKKTRAINRLGSSQVFLKASNGYSIGALKISVAFQIPWSSEFMAHEDLKLSLVSLLARP